MIMKIQSLWIWTAVILAFVSVSCQPLPPEVETSTVVDFEEAVLGELTLEGYNPTTYKNVLAGKAHATLCTDAANQLNGCLYFDDILYSERGVNFGSFYSDFKELWGGVFETVYAFVISSNHNLEVPTVHNQYSVYSTTNGKNKFAIAYDSTWFAPDWQNRYGLYDLPTITFDEPSQPVSAKIANSTYVYQQIMLNDPNLCFAMKAVGYLGDELVSEMSFDLANRGNIVTNWKSISLESLGTVDKICFTVDWSRTSSEVKPPESWCPFGFCLDDFTFRTAE